MNQVIFTTITGHLNVIEDAQKNIKALQGKLTSKKAKEELENYTSLVKGRSYLVAEKINIDLALALEEGTITVEEVKAETLNINCTETQQELTKIVTQFS